MSSATDTSRILIADDQRDVLDVLKLLLKGEPFAVETAALTASLGIIAYRAEALGRFMAGYTMLARLPAPRRRQVGLRGLVERAAAIDTRLDVVVSGEDADIAVDPDQLEQLIINLIKNAADAAGPDGDVAVNWSLDERTLRLDVLDSGPGRTTARSCSRTGTIPPAAWRAWNFPWVDR